MYNLIDTVRDASKKFAETYYERNAESTSMKGLLFDDELVVVKEATYQGFCKQLDDHC